ncbi:MAG: hypothetical protein Ct9H90mP16_21020 [Candidatus Poseidoniales archaeon]|nr:MAG: hypothetical protein Ct9H90mP16_21020 [Candidatus Poseidoniales archaeon]
MTTFYDVPAELLIPVLAERLEAHEKITQPEWADFVKTGHTRNAHLSRRTGGTSAVLRFCVRSAPWDRLELTTFHRPSEVQKIEALHPTVPPLEADMSPVLLYNNSRMRGWLQI